jgi:protoporphyrin/coproporphyrin ferrochelatase
MPPKSERAIILANFGGPRSIPEIRSFLTELLTDRDVVRTRLPKPLNTLLFRRVAKKRAVTVAADYATIGGKSPIHADTEWVAEQLQQRLDIPVLPFHRYLPSTHAPFLEQLTQLDPLQVDVLPMFPQFTYATTGSIARWFSKHVPFAHRLRWIKSYPDHPRFIDAYAAQIAPLIEDEAETLLLCSAHGIPKQYVDEGDPYRRECERTFSALTSRFPKAAALLSFQSQFGKAEWLRPYTAQVAQNIEAHLQGRSRVLIVPISFTSDHIETLFEIEQEHILPMRQSGITCARVPALNREEVWLSAIESILTGSDRVRTADLVRSADRAPCSE